MNFGFDLLLGFWIFIIMVNKLTTNLDKIVEYLIKGLIFILPIFWLPWTYEFFEFNKQLLLWVITPLIAIIYLSKILKSKEKIIFKRTPLDIPIIFFLGMSLFSAFFSVDKFSSFFGSYGRFSDAWFGLLACILFYFILVNQVKVNKSLQVFSLLKILIYSYGFVLLFSFLAIVGFFKKLISNNDILTSTGFNFLGGSLETLAIYSTVMVALILGLLFFYYHNEIDEPAKREIFIFRFILFLAVLFLVLINMTEVWWILLILAGLFLVFKLKWFWFKDRGANKTIIFLLAITLTAIVFLFLANLNLATVLSGTQLPREISLSQKQAFSIASKSLPTNIFFGQGPGAFSYVFPLYREPSFNSLDIWQFRFNKSSSYILEIISTLGLIGFLSYFLIISAVLYLISVFIRSSKSLNNLSKHGQDKMGLSLTLVLALVILILWQFLYVSTTALTLLFWLILALFMVIWQDLDWLKQPKNSWQPLWLKQKALAMILFLIFSGWLLLAGFGLKFWLADFYFKQADEINITRAIKLNPYRIDYRISLAKTYLNKIRSEMIKPLKYQDNSAIRDYIEAGLAWAESAAVMKPKSVVAQETLGMVYRDIGYLTKGSEPRAVSAFSQAVKFEPSNPVLQTELGKAYLSANKTKEAENSFQRALSLKSDYYEAEFGLAKVYVKTGENERALEILENLSKVYPEEEVYYELGRLYYNQEQIDKAIEQFLKTIELNPSHANALYSLGLALELEGEDAQALEYFKKVLELNPENAELRNKVFGN